MAARTRNGRCPARSDALRAASLRAQRSALSVSRHGGAQGGAVPTRTAADRYRTHAHKLHFLVVIAASARRARDRTSSPNCRRAAYTPLSPLETGRSRVRKEPPAGRACAVRARWGRELWLLRYRGGSGLTGRLCRCANVPNSPSSARAAGRCSARRGAWPLL